MNFRLSLVLSVELVCLVYWRQSAFSKRQGSTARGRHRDL